MSDESFYITTPIYYVNDRPHIGHAYTTILADVLSRTHRLLGTRTHFLTGTDEHGQKVQQAAEKAGISPKQQADATVVRFQELWEKLNISNDDFIRTTEQRHSAIVQQILQDLWDKGEIYKDEYSGWYCVSEEQFYTEKDLVDGKSPVTGAPVEFITEANYFFKMGQYQEWLIEYIESNPEYIQPDFRKNETLGFLKNNTLTDLCISRPKSRLAWGIELPFDKDYVTYVWFDALVNYISAIGYGADEAQFKAWWPAQYHLIGKDILTTHTVYWPTMLQAMGLPQPKTIFAHGWWLSGDAKMSKSLGNVVNPMDYAEQFGVDAFRYFLIAEMNLGQDASFTHELFVKRYNSDLANDLGNLASRVIKMISNGFEGRLPVVSLADLGEAEKDLWAKAQAAEQAMEIHLRGMRLDLGVNAVLQAVRDTNKYLEVKKPWVLAKEGNTQELGLTLYTAAEVLRVVSALLYPVMPSKMSELRSALGCPEGEPSVAKTLEFGVLQGQVSAVALFPRHQEKKEKEPAEAPKPKPAKQEESKVDGLISIDDVAKVELKTAKIYQAEKIEGADKLLRIEVFVGEERRQIVAGIARHYDPEELIGKTVVIVANLKPAKLRGVESQGMLLAASKGERLRLVTVDGELASGASVK